MIAGSLSYLTTGDWLPSESSSSISLGFPSCPNSLDPKEYTKPDEVRRRTWFTPQATWEIKVDLMAALSLVMALGWSMSGSEMFCGKWNPPSDNYSELPDSLYDALGAISAS